MLHPKTVSVDLAPGRHPAAGHVEVQRPDHVDARVVPEHLELGAQPRIEVEQFELTGARVESPVEIGDAPVAALRHSSAVISAMEVFGAAHSSVPTPAWGDQQRTFAPVNTATADDPRLQYTSTSQSEPASAGTNS